jgi:hypothetical protein
MSVCLVFVMAPLLIGRTHNHPQVVLTGIAVQHTTRGSRQSSQPSVGPVATHSARAPAANTAKLERFYLVFVFATESPAGIPSSGETYTDSANALSGLNMSR